jgi:protein-disulfide isomerase
MMRRRLAQVALAGAALLLCGGATRSVSWNNAMSSGAQGSHVIGNPKAKLRVAIWSSYTSPESARFAVESEGPLRLGMISSGQVAIEVRHLVRSPVDLTVAMLAECGSEAGFFVRHTGFLRRQPRWIAPLAHAADVQQQRWRYGTLAQRNRAIARDFRLYDLMEGMGVDRAVTDRCLTDPRAAQRITAQSEAAIAAGLDKAPAFAINGLVQEGVSTWPQLNATIDKSLKNP